jgi:hypothetical protein
MRISKSLAVLSFVALSGAAAMANADPTIGVDPSTESGDLRCDTCPPPTPPPDLTEEQAESIAAAGAEQAVGVGALFVNISCRRDVGRFTCVVGISLGGVLYGVGCSVWDDETYHCSVTNPTNPSLVEAGE